MIQFAPGFPICPQNFVLTTYQHAYGAIFTNIEMFSDFLHEMCKSLAEKSFYLLSQTILNFRISFSATF
jgi:hypothetical protein